MHIVMGATGHVGAAVAQALLERSEPVTVVTRDAHKAEALRTKGAHVAQVDVFDTHALRRVFMGGRRVFVLNPPAPPSSDTAAEESRSVRAIVSALEGCQLEKIVAESAYGAQAGEGIGDLSVLYDLEQALAAGPTPFSALRAAYYMSNWDASLDTARKQGKVYSMFPKDFELPMVAPHDIGQFAAKLMLGAVESTEPFHVEGPERYTPGDVARAFSEALDKPVELVETPREQLEQAFSSLGFSEAAAKSYATMTRATLDQHYEPATKPVRGAISLREYITALVKRSSG